MLEELEEIPSGLIPLYDRIIKQIQQLRCRYSQRCFHTLSIATLAHRPLHLLEMQVVAGLQKEITRLEDLKGIISMCGSFLTIRESYIYFIHQSAKDYLTTNRSAILLPAGPGPIHHDMFSRSLDALSKTLRQDIYDIKDPGPITKDVRPDPDPLASIRYSCVFWFDHLCEVDDQSLDNGTIFTFFNKHFLHWLECLSLIHEVSHGLLMIRRLLNRVQVCQIAPAIKYSDTKQ
jgi:hypothetical protein